jgi:hypothetical protein
METTSVKTCTKCGELKSLDSFGKSVNGAFGFRSQCKTRDSAYNDARRKADPEKHKQHQIRHHRKKTYGLSDADFHAMWEDALGLCEICGYPLRLTKGGYAIDHCHTSGQVRGLLCKPCNTGLGNLRDDVDRLKSAIAYLGRTNDKGQSPF